MEEASIAIVLVCRFDLIFLIFITHIHLVSITCLLWLQDNVTEREGKDEWVLVVVGCLPHGNPFLHALLFFSSSSPSPPFSFLLSPLSLSIILSHKHKTSFPLYCFLFLLFRRFHLQLQGTIFYSFIPSQLILFLLLALISPFYWSANLIAEFNF